MALMTLGLFVFETASLPFESFDRSTDWRYGQADRFDARKASQFTGPGDDKITLTGVLYGGQIGSYGALSTIRDMADAGEAYPLIDGSGNVMGNWFIKSLKETRTLFFVDGMPRKADFTLDLERAEDDAQTQSQSESTSA